MPPLMPSPSIAPTSSNMTGPRRFVVHDLGSVSIPQGLLTLEDLQAVLQKTTRALQALTDIVSVALFETCSYMCVFNPCVSKQEEKMRIEMKKG
ncbi:hypothetical protein DY000_02037057 [Brassica cretica]|uniref:Uncharacterized protein n=1 Tax=Brassica cretica TaxID=69181 RepID=A0ABQ7B590_BRACR|nr:hypothetical protein DY000_02037057 [Brassica cretica]